MNNILQKRWIKYYKVIKRQLYIISLYTHTYTLSLSIYQSFNQSIYIYPKLEETTK